MMNVLRNLAGAAALGACFLLPLSAARAEPTETIRAGTTTVVFAPEFLGAATQLKLHVAPIGPGRVLTSKWKGTRASFPITTGAVDLGGPKAEIAHVGGLSLTAKDGTRVELTSFIIDLTGAGSPVLTGLVTANDSLLGRVPLFDLSAPDLTGTTEDILKASGVKATLTEAAAGALNRVFKVTAFKMDIPIGTASVRAILEFEGH